MSLRSQVLVAVFLVVTPVILVGLARRQRLGAPRWFAPYLLASVVGSGLALFWPASFYTPEFYGLKEAVIGVLRVALMLELGAVVLASFPTAAARWRAVAFPIAMVTLLLLARLFVYGPGSYAALARIQTWTTWGFVILGLLVTYHNLPIEEWHRAIVLALATYGGIAAALAEALHQWGGGALLSTLLAAVNAYGWTGVVLYWSWAAWQPERAAAVSTFADIDTGVNIAVYRSGAA